MREVEKPIAIETEPASEFWLWVGFLLPPVTWAVQLQVLYLTSEWGCVNSRFFPNHVACAAALLLSLAGLFISWREWTSRGSRVANESGSVHSRQSFMALLGILTGSLFSLVIIAQWLPTILGVPCDK